MIYFVNIFVSNSEILKHPSWVRLKKDAKELKGMTGKQMSGSSKLFIMTQNFENIATQK